jgi:chromosome segregation protein
LADRLVQQAQDLSVATHEREVRRESGAQLRTTCREHEERIEQGRAAQAECQEEKTRLEVSIAEKRVSAEHLDTTVQERYEVSIRQVLSQYVESDMEIQAGEERRQELRNTLARLGEVNPAAAGELSEIEERHTFLKSQESDLHTSIADLQNTITKLNRESRDRFKETFALVNEKFREVYARLVEGGKAEVALTDENDLTNSGVEISVQPPGKRLRSLQLLSGGEKALAALSFTFALFLIRPSPFCVLDEVDAPLDDANVGRFNQLVRAMSESTQVVLITHNKRTMEAASTLYGVTMQEPGVSTVVSVSMS